MEIKINNTKQQENKYISHYHLTLEHSNIVCHWRWKHLLVHLGVAQYVQCFPEGAEQYPECTLSDTGLEQRIRRRQLPQVIPPPPPRITSRTIYIT